MAKPTKPSAADRTVDMFAVIPQQERPIEAVEAEEKGERTTLETGADEMRAKAFAGQEWATKYFGKPDATGNEYRVSLQNGVYCVEALHKKPDGTMAYGYTGVMVHENDLYNLVRVLVEAVKEKQKRDAQK